MKHVVSFSGGRTSAYLVHLMEQKRKSEGWDVDYVFMDTGAEHPKTYEFVRNVVNHFGIKLHCIRAKVNKEHGVGVTYQELSVNEIGWDLSIWESFISKYGSPSVVMGKCTDRLKTVPHDKFCNDRYGRNNYITWLGIRADESRRLREKKGIKYMAELSDFKKQDVLNFWCRMHFDLEIDDWLGNCVFCVKKGLNKLAVAAIQEPELKSQWIESQKLADQSKVVKNAEMYRGKLTLEGIAKLHERSKPEDIISAMRIRRGCAIDQGESCEVFGCQGDLFEGDL